MKYQNIVVEVSNYRTEQLPKTLIKYGDLGFRFVNVIMAQNKYGIETMYLFFTKEETLKEMEN